MANPYHPTVQAVRECADELDQMRAEAAAEAAAELAHERWLEDAGSRWDPEGYEHERRLELDEACRLESAGLMRGGRVLWTVGP
jgi:hypothetical protein